MDREPEDESSTRPPELQPWRTRGRPVPDVPPVPPSTDQSTPAVDRTVLRIVAAHYLTQQARLVPLGTGARFGSGDDGQPYVELPLAADQPPERMPIEGLPPKGTVVHTAFVSTSRGPKQEFHVFVCPAPTARAAQEGLDEAVLQYVIDEVGADGVERMAQQMLQGGLTVQLDPRPQRSSGRRQR